MNRANRYWLAFMTPAWITGALWRFIADIRRDAAMMDASDLTVRFLGALAWSSIVMLLLIGMPLRAALNLAIRDRRVEYRWETVVLLATYAIVWRIIYVVIKYPPQG